MGLRVYLAPSATTFRQGGSLCLVMRQGLATIGSCR
jgi:hypothetical protein